jgi:gamma-glutamyltranspeptidase/glutathione hydrolase
MHGAIAAGSDATADAGAEILRAGGNAVDAAVGACFAVAAAEPTLTSLGGSGVLIYRSGETGEAQVCDFFSNAPGLGGRRPDALDFHAVDVDFGPAVQEFHIGAGSAAVPGAIPGFCTALERWGRLPLSRVIEPACRLLREGVELGTWGARAVAVLEPILLATESGRLQFAPEGHLIRAGDRYRLPVLADTLEAMASHAGGWNDYYLDVIGERMVRQSGPAAGGWVSAEDLAEFNVEVRRPLEGSYHDRAIYLNPPPAFGGRMVALMLRLLESTEVAPEGSVEQLHALCRAMQVADEARGAGDDGLAERRYPEWVRRFAARADAPLTPAPPPPGGPGSTTHVSVIDEEGNAASVTFSYGEGNGIIIEGTGIMMNNLLGEEDLFPEGFHCWTTGVRLSTMMCPMLMVSPAGDVTVMGTGGANRIRSALLQVISNLVDQRMPVERAVRAPRVHYEAGVLNAEVFDRDDAGATAELGARERITFDEPNLFFGGVHLVRRTADGTLEGAGDIRRGGACRVV